MLLASLLGCELMVRVGSGRRDADDDEFELIKFRLLPTKLD
jgi:hypothetical protein